jgi:hypothetical protein
VVAKTQESAKKPSEIYENFVRHTDDNLPGAESSFFEDIKGLKKGKMDKNLR